jgi:hypothetical protein
MTTYTARIGHISHTYRAASDSLALAEAARVAKECRGRLDRVIKHDGSPATDLPAEDVTWAGLVSR